MGPSYSIIIPTKNEEEAIAKVLCSIPKKIKKSSEILVVDSSTDATPKIAEELGAKVVRLSKKGKGRAMRAGVEKSKGGILIFLDGDGTDPPGYIPLLLKTLKRANLVLGSRTLKRFKRDDMMTRTLFELNHVTMIPLFKLAGFNFKVDPLAGFRAIRRSDWEKLDLKSNHFQIEAEMNLKAMEKGFVIKGVAIPHLKRLGGLLNSKMANPKEWIKVIDYVLGYIKDKRLKTASGSAVTKPMAEI